MSDEHSAESGAASCRECGRPLPEFRMGDFIEVDLDGKWKRALIISGSATAHLFGVAVVGHERLLAYGNPEVIPGAERFLRKVRVTPPAVTEEGGHD